MNQVVEHYKRNLKLEPLSIAFYDYVVEVLGIHATQSKELAVAQLSPWFGTTGDRPQPQEYTQYTDEKVHQKYRIALEFCAIKANLHNIIGWETGADPADDAEAVMRPVSYGRFWFKGAHPNDVQWILRQDKDKIACEGKEVPGSLNLDTMERWLKSHIEQFRGLA
jgi:hypothetical protein